MTRATGPIAFREKSARGLSKPRISVAVSEDNPHILGYVPFIRALIRLENVFMHFLISCNFLGQIFIEHFQGEG